MKPKVLVLKTDGINRDEETAFAFKLAGGDPHVVHINNLRSKKEKLKNYQILAIPGGFSYGDDIVSGKILAIELTSFFADELKKFVERKNTLIIGICNGFQVLVRTGLLPFGKIGSMQTTLTNNDSGKFECRWITMRVEKNSRCVFLNNGFYRHSGDPPAGGDARISYRNETLPAGRQGSWTSQDDVVVSYPIAHGEGKFFTDQKTLDEIEKQNLVVFRYVDPSGHPTMLYPYNPNGALQSIGGICDTTGRVLGLMPHPECFVRMEQHPNWRRMNIENPARNASLPASHAKQGSLGASVAGGPHGLPLFENMVQFVKTQL